MFLRFTSRRGNLFFGHNNIFGDHSVSFGFGYCGAIGYPAQYAGLVAKQKRAGCDAKASHAFQG